MRVLKREELEMVSGATHVGTKPKAVVTGRHDNGKHVGWCRGHGNTGESQGNGKGVQLTEDGVNKHGIHTGTCKGLLR